MKKSFVNDSNLEIDLENIQNLIIVMTERSTVIFFNLPKKTSNDSIDVQNNSFRERFDITIIHVRKLEFHKFGISIFVTLTD